MRKFLIWLLGGDRSEVEDRLAAVLRSLQDEIKKVEAERAELKAENRTVREDNAVLRRETLHRMWAMETAVEKLQTWEATDD